MDVPLRKDSALFRGFHFIQNGNASIKDCRIMWIRLHTARHPGSEIRDYDHEVIIASWKPIISTIFIPPGSERKSFSTDILCQTAF